MRPLTPDELWSAQVLSGVTMAALVGTRFLPMAWRRPVGIGLTALYALAVLAGLAVILSR
jgi:hypothetical protein